MLALLLLVALAPAATLTVPKTLYERCTKAKDIGSCFELGHLYQNCSGPGDIELGNQYVHYGCKLELKRKCTLKEANARRAVHIKARSDWEKEQDRLMQAMPTLKTEDELKCEKGDGKACGSAALHYQFLAPILNPPKAKALYEEGCKLGDDSSCETLKLIRKGIIRVFNVEL